MHKMKVLLLAFSFIAIFNCSIVVQADQLKKARRFQPFAKMQPRKPLFGIKEGKESLPIRPVLKLTSQYHALRNIKVIAHARLQKWETAESYFDVLAFKTNRELLKDEKLIKECGEVFGFKQGTYKLRMPKCPEDCIRVVELRTIKTNRQRH